MNLCVAFACLQTLSSELLKCIANKLFFGGQLQLKPWNCLDSPLDVSANRRISCTFFKIIMYFCAQLKIYPALTLSLPDRPHYYFPLSNARRFYSSRKEPMCAKGLTGPIFLPFHPRPAKTGPFIILLCLPYNRLRARVNDSFPGQTHTKWRQDG